MALSGEQRAGLWRAKLAALARDGLGRLGGVEHPTPWGAALESDGVWTVLIDADASRAFGQALVLAARHQATSIDLLVDSAEAHTVARRAALFDPSPSVWAIDGPELTDATDPTDPTAVEPAGELDPDPAPQIEPSIAAILDMPEVRTIVEHGVVFGECRGLEVARVTGLGADQRLDVGVGAYDQGAFAVMNPDLTPQQSLAEVVAQVLTHRRRGAEPHPLNRLVRERWLRDELLDDPSPLGLTELNPVPGPNPRDGLNDVAPAFAHAPGQATIVACSVGIDLDLVPAVAEVAARHRAERIVAVLPDRDRHRSTEALAARCRTPIEFASADQPWG